MAIEYTRTVRIGSGSVVHAAGDTGRTVCGTEPTTVSDVEGTVSCKRCLARAIVPATDATPDIATVLADNSAAPGTDVLGSRESSPVYYSAGALLQLATLVADGWSKTTVTLRDGDTAYAPGTSKYVLSGPGTVTYFIHASGWETEHEDTVTRVPAPAPDFSHVLADNSAAPGTDVLGARESATYSGPGVDAMRHYASTHPENVVWSADTGWVDERPAPATDVATVLADNSAAPGTDVLGARTPATMHLHTADDSAGWDVLDVDVVIDPDDIDERPAPDARVIVHVYPAHRIVQEYADYRSGSHEVHVTCAPCGFSAYVDGADADHVALAHRAGRIAYGALVVDYPHEAGPVLPPAAGDIVTFDTVLGTTVTGTVDYDHVTGSSLVPVWTGDGDGWRGVHVASALTVLTRRADRPAPDVRCNVCGKIDAGVTVDPETADGTGVCANCRFAVDHDHEYTGTDSIDVLRERMSVTPARIDYDTTPATGTVFERMHRNAFGRPSLGPVGIGFGVGIMHEAPESPALYRHTADYVPVSMFGPYDEDGDPVHASTVPTYTR